jgi:enolase
LGAFVKQFHPSGALTRIYEALELRDEGERFHGRVLKAVENVNLKIGPKLIEKDVTKQKEIDDYMVKTLDGSKNEWGYSKSVLGANAILGVSLVVCRAGAAAKKIPLYQHMLNLLETKRLYFLSILSMEDRILEMYLQCKSS